MTTVQEELEQSTEDIANATEETLQPNQELTVVNDKNLTDSNNDCSVNRSTSNAKERLGYEKDTISVHSSKDAFNNQCKPQSAIKVSSSGAVPLTTISHTASSLPPTRISSVHSSSIHSHNPSSSSPTVQAITTTQVSAGTTVATVHESVQVCIFLIDSHLVVLYRERFGSIIALFYLIQHISRFKSK